MKVLSLLRCMAACIVLACFAGMANAGTCTISEHCQADAKCDHHLMTLSWSEGRNSEILVNDFLMSADWIEEPVEVGEFQSNGSVINLRTRGAFIHASEGRTSVMITPGGVSDEIVVTTINIPERYVDYENAMQARLVFNGTCEGLF